MLEKQNDCQMDIIVTAFMGNGTIQAALEPLSRIRNIKKIYFLRKEHGPEIPKVEYIVLPAVCKSSLFNLILTPFLLTYYSIKYKVSYIISYHVIPYAFIATIASFFSRRPYFVCQTGLYIQRKVDNVLFWFILKRILKRAKAFCVPGKSSYNFWLEKGITPSKVIILHATVDTAKYRPNLGIEKLYDFIYVGRIDKEKRIDFLLRAFAIVTKKYPDVRLVLIGNGALLEDVKYLAKSLYLLKNIYFAGYHSDVLPWLNRAKFILISSETEGLPVAVMEGMSAGLVPITTDVGNLSDVVINGDTGYLVTDKNDMAEFAEKMKTLLSKDRNEIKTMSNKARNLIIKNHSHNNSYEKWSELLRSK